MNQSGSTTSELVQLRMLDSQKTNRAQVERGQTGTRDASYASADRKKKHEQTKKSLLGIVWETDVLGLDIFTATCVTNGSGWSA